MTTNSAPGVPADGIFLTDLNTYVSGTGQRIGAIHPVSLCEGRSCVIHNPSDHSMRSFPTHFRTDKYLMERICPHGIGHPDPDDMAYHNSLGDSIKGTHGCDGCCGN